MKYYTVITTQDGIEVEFKDHPNKDAAIQYSLSKIREYGPDENAEDSSINEESGEGWAIDIRTGNTHTWHICAEHNFRYEGSILIGTSCDCTDPSYDKAVRCRHTVHGMLPGRYNCYCLISDEGEWGDRVAESWIIQEGCDKETRPSEDPDLKFGYTTEVGVDSGLFGYFAKKPDLNDREWQDFCNAIRHQYPTSVVSKFRGTDGFVTSSGYADGGYEVVTWKDSDEKIVAISTRFI